MNMEQLRCAYPMRDDNEYRDGPRRLCGDPAHFLVNGTSLCPKHAQQVQLQPLMRNEL